MTKPLSGAGRGESSIDLPADAPRPGESKQAWVYRQVRARILKGSLSSGARLPSTRSLAGRWRISRATVEAAYDQLRSEGYATSTVGSGTYVAAVIPDRFFRRGLADGIESLRPQGSPQNASAEHAKQWQATIPPGQPFISRMADASLFSMDAWRKRLMSSAKGMTPAQLANDEPQGCRLLREQIARYLGAARGISCDADQIVVLAGIRDGLDLSARLLLSSQDTALVEDPGYMNATRMFSQFARRVVPIPVDEQGFSVAAARRQRTVKLVHVTPAHQSPTGITMPVSRRLELLSWAEEAGSWIFEDDYDSEFNYESAPLPALKSLDAGDRVIHCGSFNKTMFNALRIGYAVVPKRWVPAFSRARYTTGRSTSVIEQVALASFLESGGFARHIRKARSVYAGRRDLIMQMLKQAVGVERLSVSGEHAGFHLVWWLPPDLDITVLLHAAQTHNLRFQSISEFCQRAVLPPGLVIGYSGLQNQLLQEHGAVMRRMMASTGFGQDCAHRCSGTE